MYYEDNSKEHHKVVCILHVVKIDRFFKKTKQKQKIKRLCPLLFTGKHYSLLVKFLEEVKFLLDGQNLSCIAKTAIHKE